MNLGKRINYIVLGIVPLIIAVAAQFILSIPFTGISFAYSFWRCSTMGITDFDMVFNAAYDIWGSVDFNAALCVVFSTSLILFVGYWYFTTFESFSPAKTMKKKFHPLMLVGILFLSVGLQYVSMYAMNFTAAINPDWMTSFEAMEDSLNMDQMTLPLALYAIILGPVNEELLFRGISLHFFKKAMPFWVANVLQALLFGIYHMNMIQGVYAFFIGLFLGYVCEKGGSIFFSILLHILYNFLASYGTSVLFYGESDIMYCFWLSFAVLIPIFGLWIYKTGIKKNSPAS